MSHAEAPPPARDEAARLGGELSPGVLGASAECLAAPLQPATLGRWFRGDEVDRSNWTYLQARFGGVLTEAASPLRFACSVLLGFGA